MIGGSKKEGDKATVGLILCSKHEEVFDLCFMSKSYSHYLSIEKILFCRGIF